jgi:hypothetical protein
VCKLARNPFSGDINKSPNRQTRHQELREREVLIPQLRSFATPVQHTALLGRTIGVVAEEVRAKDASAMATPFVVVVVVRDRPTIAVARRCSTRHRFWARSGSAIVRPGRAIPRRGRSTSRSRRHTRNDDVTRPLVIIGNLPGASAD